MANVEYQQFTPRMKESNIRIVITPSWREGSSPLHRGDTFPFCEHTSVKVNITVLDLTVIVGVWSSFLSREKFPVAVH